MTQQAPFTLPAQARAPDAVAVVGAGRMGTALAASLRAAGITVEGPLRRGEAPSDHTIHVLLCVPDAQIETAATPLRPHAGLLVGHASAVTTLAALAPHEAFSLHPLMMVTAGGATFAGATAAIAGAPQRALQAAGELALFDALAAGAATTVPA